MVPLFKVYMDKGVPEAVSKVLMSGYIGEGEKVKEFESALEKRWNKKIVLVNSCTSALHLAYHMVGIKGYEVITSPMTCTATNIPILHNGGKIVWADVDMTGNISVDDVAKKINSKTKAVVVTHYGGRLCDPRIVDLCDEKGIALIEDCAHLATSGYGDYQCYSFQAIKFLTTGDGGALVTGNKEIYERAKLLRWYGMDRSRSDMRCLDPVNEAGYKFHMNDISATIGLENLKTLDSRIVKTFFNAQYYNEKFGVEGGGDYWLYILMVDNQIEFAKRMKESGIAVSPVHARNDIHPIFSKSRCDLPGLDKFFEKQICIPVGWWLTQNEREYIAGKVME